MLWSSIIAVNVNDHFDCKGSLRMYMSAVNVNDRYDLKW